MSTQSTSRSTTRRSMLGQMGMLLLIIVALGVFGTYMLQPLPGRAGTAKSVQGDNASAINTPSGHDVLSGEWLEQQRATKAAVPSSARTQNDVLSVEWLEQQHATRAAALSLATTQNDVLSVEWLEQNRQSNTNVPRGGSRPAQPILDNYIGFIE